MTQQAYALLSRQTWQVQQRALMLRQCRRRWTNITSMYYTYYTVSCLLGACSQLHADRPANSAWPRDIIWLTEASGWKIKASWCRDAWTLWGKPWDILRTDLVIRILNFGFWISDFGQYRLLQISSDVKSSDFGLQTLKFRVQKPPLGFNTLNS